MCYTAPDGESCRSYTALCDYMYHKAIRMGDMKSALYYKEEKQKMINRQERTFPFFLIFIALGGICLLLDLLGII